MFNPPNFDAGPSMCGVQAPSLGTSGTTMLAPIQALGKGQVFKSSSGSALAPIVGWRLTWMIKDREGI
jgi:hypothetical protein